MKKEFLISILLLFSWTLGLPQYDAVAQDSSKLTAAELQNLHLQRIQEKLNVYSEADVNFMQDMIVHHSQALVMSQFAPLNGASKEVQVLAARIINAQLDEIKIMQHWLLDRGVAAPAVEYNGIESMMTMIQPSKPDVRARMAAPAPHNNDVKMSHEGMDHGAQDHSAQDHGTMDNKIMSHEGMDHNSMDHGGTDHSSMDHGAQDHSAHMDHSDMVGMLSLEQLAELRDAHGRLFDKLYLEYMIQHHEGAVVMVRELFSYDGAALGVQTYKLASDIQVSQRTEITRMQQMLNVRNVVTLDN
jgi:uncharacterized protein (DUF305 family)